MTAPTALIRTAALTALSVAWLDEAAVRAVDPTLACFANVNRPADLPR